MVETCLPVEEYESTNHGDVSSNIIKHSNENTLNQSNVSLLQVVKATDSLEENDLSILHKIKCLSIDHEE
jgi:hypothetical protein